MTGPLSGAEAYYANFGSKSVSDYVTEEIMASATEMERLGLAERLVPADTATLLDVGAGPGVFLHLLRAERAVNGIGIELTPSKVEYARDVLHLDVRVGSADRLPFDDRSFDTVTAFEVIEHLPFGVYETALAEICRVAKRHVLIAVPYRERRVMVRCPYCDARFHPHYHMRSFDDDVLRNLTPALRLSRLQTHGSVRELMWPVNRLYEARAARNRRLPPYALCPSCGYREGAPPTVSSGEADPPPSRSWASMLTRWTPRVSRPRWAFALYEKTA
jgi:hypothetical protein